MASANKLLYQVSTALVVLLFALAGTMKLIPNLSPETHGELKHNFRKFARIPPMDIFKLDADVYRMAVGITELGCVVAILFLDRRVRVLATYILLLFMVGALYTHFMVGDTLKEAGGAIFGLTMVLIRLYTMGNLEIKLRVD